MTETEQIDMSADRQQNDLVWSTYGILSSLFFSIEKDSI